MKSGSRGSHYLITHAHILHIFTRAHNIIRYTTAHDVKHAIKTTTEPKWKNSVLVAACDDDDYNVCVCFFFSHSFHVRPSYVNKYITLYTYARYNTRLLSTLQCILHNNAYTIFPGQKDRSIIYTERARDHCRCCCCCSGVFIHNIRRRDHDVQVYNMTSTTTKTTCLYAPGRAERGCYDDGIYRSAVVTVFYFLFFCCCSMLVHYIYRMCTRRRNAYL